jgi:exopolysaccharide production protein ExoY
MAVGIASARPVDARVDGLATEPPPQVIGGNAKRAMDIALALIALVLAAPIMLLVAAAIRSSMGGPVLFSQERVGWGGRPFRCLKFRTMVTNGDEVLRRHLAADAEAKREWEATCKLADDPRVTRLGLLLRKSSLDELPQIVNILRGEMSCVGPRPVVPREIERYGALKDAYLDARPGLTGLWQTSGRSKLSYQDRVELDAEYARTWSLLLDVRIILRTIPALLKFDQSA